MTATPGPANLRDEMLTPSVYGSSDRGHGHFSGVDQLKRRPISMWFLIDRQ